jgi:hypothetical protein
MEVRQLKMAEEIQSTSKLEEVIKKGGVVVNGFTPKEKDNIGLFFLAMLALFFTPLSWFYWSIIMFGGAGTNNNPAIILWSWLTTYFNNGPNPDSNLGYWIAPTLILCAPTVALLVHRESGLGKVAIVVITITLILSVIFVVLDSIVW